MQAPEYEAKASYKGNGLFLRKKNAHLSACFHQHVLVNQPNYDITLSLTSYRDAAKRGHERLSRSYCLLQSEQEEWLDHDLDCDSCRIIG